jgi:predicted RNase H-like nuclease (RuvC/YqgF family)
LLEDELNQQVKAGEKFRDALEKEQENAYQILNELHAANSENKALKDSLDEKSREARALKEENKRLIEKCRDCEIENDKIRKDHGYLLSRSEIDIKKL